MNESDFFCMDADEKPLDHLATDGGYAGILRSVVCVGDSLDSGEFEIFDVNNRRVCSDRFEYSWLSYFARFTGNEIRHFTRGGMSVKEYCTSFGDAQNLWDRKKAANAYVITLAANDISQILKGKLEFGEPDDIDLSDWRKNKPTYCGYYGQIIQRYREISPRCRIFVCAPYYLGNPGESAETIQGVRVRQQQFLYELEKKFSFLYVIDLLKYVEVSEALEKCLWMNGHMTPAGYLWKGRIMTSYMDYLIRHHWEDFAQIGLIGADIYDPKYKW